ncbi:serine protease snake-like protein [Dinothrombium tinctorium]|uniref:Serine protease snake-like protein n=1 Tax=Dinothrombium tinctorium TaxID=1965070 RepID=A0A3S3SH36_9ACAR|nr:serine protease snake-like protein [Dinothrombium tinctorium]
MLEFEDEEMSIAGWGATSAKEKQTDYLMEATVEEQDFETCNVHWQRTLNSTFEICAGKKNADSCIGDNGGPLMYSKDGMTYLIGVFSFSRNPCGRYKDTVYTRVTSYLNWIEKCFQYEI